MTIPPALLAWIAAGVPVGALHAWLLWRGRAHPMAALVRMGLVGAWLFVAAIAGALPPAAAGWLVGMLGQGAYCYGRATP